MSNPSEKGHIAPPPPARAHLRCWDSTGIAEIATTAVVVGLQYEFRLQWVFLKMQDNARAGKAECFLPKERQNGDLDTVLLNLECLLVSTLMTAPLILVTGIKRSRAVKIVEWHMLPTGYFLPIFAQNFP